MWPSPERALVVDSSLAMDFDRAAAAFERTVRRRSGGVEVAAPLGRSASLRHEVALTLGPPVRSAGRSRVSSEVRWWPVGHRILVPGFRGTLEVVEGNGPSDVRLRLAGTYRVPLGPLGLAFDGVVGRRIARRSLTELLAAWRSELTAAAVDVTVGPPPYAEPLRED